MENFSNDIRKPNKKRFLAALRHETFDRVPNWEFTLMRRNTEAVLGSRTLAEVEERYRNLDTPWPARSESEKHDKSALAGYSCYLPPEQYAELLKATGMDTVVCTLSWKPKSRKAERSGVLARGQEGIISGREDLHELPEPPSIESMTAVLDYYLDAFRGTDIGVGVLVRSVFCNSYETLGMENFMLKMYDDPGLIEILFDKFHSYSENIAREVASRGIDFFAVDDDLCDNNGFLVNPSFLKDQWMGRTSEIVKPVLDEDIPIIYHCCGNLKDVLPLAVDLGFSAVHPVQPNCNNIYEYKKEYGSDLCFIGNIDLAGSLTRGTPEDVRNETKEHIDLLSPGGGYIVSSSHSITDDVPPENYRAMIETVWDYGRYT